jgi:uncharacterized protein YjbI with pentapeptide repeats
MRSLLQSLFSGTETEESTVSKDERSEERPEGRSEQETIEAPEGLIPASELPSAADVLEDLFRNDAPPPPVEHVAHIHQKDESAPRPAITSIPPIPDESVVEPAPVAEPEAPSEADLVASTDVALDALPQPETLPQPEKTSASEVPFTTVSSPDGDISPEVALSIDLAEQAVDEAAKREPPPASVVASAPAESVPAAAAPPPAVPSSDWAFEEKLAAHKEWVESRGAAGRKADLAEADLEHTDLISVDLRCADLQGANMKNADLLLADLRDACLVRTNLEESCLVGANLEGANLEGATLDGAMGLLPRQLAGANLHDASLPDQIARFEARALFAKASQTAMKFFTATMAISAVSALVIWKTKDLQLLSDSSILPFLHSRTAADALPTAQIYLMAPVALFIVYLVLQFHLQTLWDSVVQLPWIFPDGSEIGQDSPRIIRALLRAHFRWMNKDAPSTRTIERMLALALAYWVAPVTLLLFWARYLTVQDLRGTALHDLLVAVASGVALYSTTKIGSPQGHWSPEAGRSWQWLAKLRDLNPLKGAVGVAVVLLFLSVGTVKGVPHSRSRAPQFSAASIRRWAPDALWFFGYDPYANLTEASISIAPANWTGADSQISAVKGARLADMNFRYAQAYGVFLANAHLWHSDFEGAFLSDADFRGADLGQTTLRYAVMDRARLYHANLDRGNLDNANLDRADFRESNLSYCSLTDAVLIDAQFQSASLYGARLSGASMERANLEKTDLRSSYLDGADLEHADLQNAYFWSARLSGAVLRSAQLGSTIFINADLRDTDLRGAQFLETVLTGANLTGAIVDGTDLRGALGLTASQICSTKSRAGAILADSLASQVQVACGGPLLAAPAAVSQVPPTTAATQSPSSKLAKGASRP